MGHAAVGRGTVLGAVGGSATVGDPGRGAPAEAVGAAGIGEDAGGCVTVVDELHAQASTTEQKTTNQVARFLTAHPLDQPRF